MKQRYQLFATDGDRRRAERSDQLRMGLAVLKYLGCVTLLTVASLAFYYWMVSL